MNVKSKLRYNQLTAEQISNPHLFIAEFCRYEIDIEVFRKEVQDMIRAACSTRPHGNSDDYFYNYRCLLQLLEVGHIFYCRGMNFSLQYAPSALSPGMQDLARYYNLLINSHFKNLSKEEVKNTMCFFKDFFSFMSFKEWRLMMGRIAEYAYRKHTIDEVMEDGSTLVIVKEYIEKLIEVIYMIDITQKVIYVDLPKTLVN